MNHYINLGLLPHAVTFVAQNGEVVHHKAFGWRNMKDSVPCEKDDLFRMASQTKAIAVVTLMTLWEEGLFQLDEPIKKYITSFADAQVLTHYNPKTGKYKTRPAKRDITIRDLMTHTSGISYYGDHWAIKEEANVPPLVSKENYTLEEVVNRLGTLPLAHDPGEAFTYSMNIEVLGRLAEIISGKDIRTLIHERILDPLQMDNTDFYLTDSQNEKLVTLYSYPENGPLQESKHELFATYPISGAKSYYSTGAGLVGPIEDYARFCQMILNGGDFLGKRIIGRKTLEYMQVNQVGDLRGSIGFGLAWDVFMPKHAHKSIISDGSMRWGGMFGTDYVIDPSENLIILIYTNMEPNHTGIDFKALMHQVTYQALKN